MSSLGVVAAQAVATTKTDSCLGVLLKPSLEHLGLELGDKVKRTIENLKEGRREKNLRDHLENVRARIKAEYPDFAKQPTIETLQGLNTFEALVEGAEDIDPGDSELSAIWEQLLFKIATGVDVHMDLIKRLREIDAMEAKMLLVLRDLPHFVFANFYPSHRELSFLKTLKNRDLVTLNQSLLILPVVALFLLGTFVWPYLNALPMDAQFRYPAFGFILVITGYTMFCCRGPFQRWQLTWRGSELVQHVKLSSKILSERDERLRASRERAPR
jgi:hypothetical protein